MDGDAKTYIGEDNTHSIQTLTGNFFDLVNPAPHMVFLRDIAEAAAKVNRFTGHTIAPYSVAQHCVWASFMVSPEAAPYALLHDAHEAYINDKSTPQKTAEAIVIAHALGIDLERVKEALRIIPRRIDAAVFQRFNLPWPAQKAIMDEVKAVDILALSTEKRDLMAHDRPWTYPLPAPYRGITKPWPWVHAADAFVERARHLGLQEMPF
ncbi:MAG: hypothetical protein AB7I36_08435 [Rhodospirillaceae bacterium]